MFYSRDEIVAVITDYYLFLCRINQPPEALNVPPEGGWTTIPVDALKTHGRRTDDVIDLLKRLPYINLDGVEPQILPETNCTDYAHLPPEYQEALSEGRFDGIVEPSLDDDEALDPDCVCIADGRRHAWCLILDLTHGTVIWHSNDGEWRDEEYDLGTPLPEDSPRRVESDQEWRDQPTYDIKYFFGEFCKRRLIELNWIPHCDGEVRSAGPRAGGKDEVRRQVLRDAGFPGEDGGGLDRQKWFEDERLDNL